MAVSRTTPSGGGPRGHGYSIHNFGTKAVKRSHVVRAVVTLSFAIVLCVALVGCSTLGPAPSGSSSAADPIGVWIVPGDERAPLPPITAGTLAGGQLALRTLAGHDVLVVNVWASWCSECRTESPGLAKLARALGGTGVRFVGIDEQDPTGPAQAFARRTGMSYPHLIDRDGTILDKLHLLPRFGIPSTLIVDRNGRMAARIVGPATVPELRAVIAAVDT
jgi:thiol-disulfide isomerase/thioredoxin